MDIRNLNSINIRIHVSNSVLKKKTIISVGYPINIRFESKIIITIINKFYIYISAKIFDLIYEYSRTFIKISYKKSESDLLTPLNQMTSL